MADLGTQSGKLFYPYVEFTINGATPAANPFDEVCTVVFTHTVSQEQITCEAFYDGDYDWELDSSTSDVWKIRFAGTRTGEWTFLTSSANGGLDGHTGTINISAQDAGDEDLGRGFVEASADNGENGRKWIWSESGKAFVPNLAMVGEGTEYYDNNPLDIDGDITEFITESGMTGLHYSVFFAWFGINDGKHTSLTGSGDANLSPSIASIDVVEDVITKVYEAGGVVHLWEWGDDQRDQSAVHLSGGINGSVHQRLQRYISARLGAIPGWTLGAGFDLHEDWTGTQLENWHAYYNSKLGWDHVIGARGHQNDQDVTIVMTDQLDYMGHEDHATINYDGNIAYDRFVDWVNEYPNKLHFSEDRFRDRNHATPSKPFDEDRLRQTLWQTAMAGGIAAIYGRADDVLGDSPDTGHYDGVENRSFPFTNKNEFKIFGDFWKDRFASSCKRNNAITDGYGIKDEVNERLLFYKENTGSVQVDLTGLTNISAVAVDTKAASYSEIDITNDLTENQSNTWTTPSTTDWAISVEGDITTTYNDVVLEDNPVSFWPLQEESDAPSFLDLGYDENHMVMNGSPAVASPLVVGADKSYDMPGSTSAYFSDGTLILDELSGSVTFEAWGRVDSLADDRTIISIGSTDQGRLRVSDDGTLRMSVGGDNINTTETVPTGQVLHLVSVYDDVAEETRFYVNNVLLETVAGAHTIGSGSANVYLGLRVSGASNPFDGPMSHIAVYNGVLSVERIDAHYKKGTGATPNEVTGTITGGGTLDGQTGRDSLATGTLSGNGSLDGVTESPDVPANEVTGQLSGGGSLDGVTEAPDIPANEVVGSLDGGGTLQGVTEAPDIAPNEVTGTLSGGGELVGVTEAPVVGDSEAIGTISGGGELVGITEAPDILPNEVIGTLSGGGELVGVTTRDAIVIGTLSGGGQLVGVIEGSSVIIKLELDSRIGQSLTTKSTISETLELNSRIRQTLNLTSRI